MKLEDEVRDALRQRAPDDDTRAAWARAALERAPARRRIRPLWPAVAAAAILAVWLWPREKAPQKDIPPPDAAADEAARRLNSTSVDEQRAANLKFLEEARKRDTLKNAKERHWVVVVGGDSLRVAKEPAVAWADELYPEAKHRFLLPVGRGKHVSGDVIVDRAPVAPATAGSWFFQNTGIEAEGELELEVNGRTVAVRVDKESSAPLVLPAGVAFPKFEIPGRMILEDMDRNWRSFRRYYVRVRCDEPKLDKWTEVIGAESAEPYAPGHWVAVRLGGHVFHALRRDPKEQAAMEDKPLLVLRFKEGSTKYLNELFERVEIDGYAQRAVPKGKKTVLQRYHRDGRLAEELTLPDAAPETLSALRAFLRRG